MAIIKQGILGGIQKKIGNIVGTSWKGIAVIKSLPISVANPRTAAQVEQRSRFSNCVSFAVAILAEVIKPLWDRFSQKQSGYNAFISNNIAYFDNTGLIAPSNLEISRGKMSQTTITTANASSSELKVTVNWNNDAGQGFKQSTDIAYIVVMNANTKEVRGFDTGVQRTAQTATVEMKMEVGETIHVWLAFKRVDGTIVSDTSYKTTTAT